MTKITSIIVVSGGPHESYPPHGRPNVLHNLLPHQVQRHGHDRHPQQYVDVAHDELGPRLDVLHAHASVPVDVLLAGHEVAEADGHETGWQFNRKQLLLG